MAYILVLSPFTLDFHLEIKTKYESYRNSYIIVCYFHRYNTSESLIQMTYFGGIKTISEMFMILLRLTVGFCGNNH